MILRAMITAAVLGVGLHGQVVQAADRQPQREVCFTPGMDCTGRVVDTIGNARTSILVQAYSFTSAPIAKALVDARRRGVDVRAILDKSQRTERYSGADFLANSGVPVQIDASHAIAHNKVMVIDGSTVITGSFNSGEERRKSPGDPRRRIGCPIRGKLAETCRAFGTVSGSRKKII